MFDLKSTRPAKVKRNRRKREKSPLDWKRLLSRALRISVTLGTVVLTGTGAVAAGRLLYDSDHFRIASVRVESGERVSAEEILALSEIQTGTSIFELDLERIGKQIEENPWVAAATVQRVFPQEVVIRVVERQPRAVVNLGYLYYVDAAGEVFKVLEPQDRLDFPVITGIGRRELLENPSEARRLLAGAIALLEEVEGRSFFNAADLSEIHIDPLEGFRLHTLVGGVPILMGFGEFDDKLDRLERIFPELQPSLKALTYIDLNVSDRVIVKLDTKTARDKG